MEGKASVPCVFDANPMHRTRRRNQGCIRSAANGGYSAVRLPAIARSGVVVDARTLLLDLSGSDAGSVIGLPSPLVVIQSALQLDPE